MTQLLIGGTAVLLREGTDGLQVLMIRRPGRGSFADAWVFPGGVVDDIDRLGVTAVQDAARAAAVRETHEEIGLIPASESLVALSRWTPPDQAPKRVDTWFFLARDPGGAIRPAAAEVVEWAWLRPADALARHAAGGFTLVPPTWVTLYGLQEFADADGALAAASEPVHHATRMLPGGVFAWAGDAEHPDGADGVHRLETAVLPWTYRRG